MDKNPIVFPPDNIIQRGAFAIKDYLRDFSQGFDEWKELKVIVIGDEHVGKVVTTMYVSFYTQTTIVEAIHKTSTTLGKITSNFTKVNVTHSTVGIDMRSIKILDDVTIHLWDFAGQPQYSNTHRVKNSVKFH